MELEGKIIAKKSQLFQPEMGRFWFWQQNITHRKTENHS